MNRTPIILILLVTAACLAAVRRPTAPRPLGGTSLTITNPAPHGLTLAWNIPSNCWYIIQGSVDLTNWYFKTNVALNVTNVFIQTATNQPREFYRIGTYLQLIDGGFYAQNLPLTNL